MAQYAFVTLITSDHYLPGALALAAALKDVHDSLDDTDIVCLVTPETVDVKSIKLLRRAFSHLIGVEIIEQRSPNGLKLLGRPDLAHVLTKLHAFRLTSYSRIVFLDADVLPLQPLKQLFFLPHEFAAVPDVGWPDIFNSGVMAFKPGQDKFDELMNILKTEGSWDGGDQGVLNEWRGDNWYRLSFTYNTTPTAAYTYAPAYTRFGSDIKAVHFIGPDKPWLSLPYRAPYSQSSLQKIPSKLKAFGHGDMVDRWFAVYDKHYRPQELVTQPESHVRRYESVWNASESESAQSFAPPLGLDELKRLAIEGSAVDGPTFESVMEGSVSEGVYWSMPLEGRFYLIPPKAPTLPPITQDEQSDLSGAYGLTPKATSPTHLQAMTDSAQTPYQPPLPSPSLARSTPQAGYFSIPLSQHQHYQSSPRSLDYSLRPPSPPMLIWDPSTEPPPSEPPPQNAFKPDECFENVWDQSWRSRGINEDPHGFFVVPPPSKIPERLIREGHYNNVISPTFSPESMIAQTLPETDSSVILSPPTPTLPSISFDQLQPDSGRVASVFPWEERPRHAPGRIFPEPALPPLVGQAIAEERNSPIEPVLSSSTPENAPRSLSPQVGGRAATASGGFFPNVWDSVPRIQRYASRLQGSRSPKIALEREGSLSRGRRRRSSSATYKSWEEPADDGSNEGDDEDEESEGDQGVSQKSRRSSRRGTQTKQVVQREAAVQSPPLPDSPPNEPFEPSRLSGKLQSAFVGSNVEIRRAEDVGTPTAEEPSNLLQSNAGKRAMAANLTASRLSRTIGSSPLVSPSQYTIDSHDAVIQPPSLHPSEEAISPKPLEAISTLRESVPVTVPSELPSPPSSLASILSSRRSGRKWNPARGVDVFKQQSEEVLTRFLGMGSWDRSS